MEQMKENKVAGEPYKSDVKKPKRTFKVLNNGDVEMAENQTTVSTFTSRDFLSFKRNHEKQIENIDKQISKEHIEELNGFKKEIKSYIDELSPIVLEAEKNAKANYEKEMMDKVVGTVKDYFKKPKKEQKPEYLAAVIANLSEEKKITLVSRLEPHEKKVLLQVKKKMMEQTRKAK